MSRIKHFNDEVYHDVTIEFRGFTRRYAGHIIQTVEAFVDKVHESGDIENTRIAVGATKAEALEKAKKAIDYSERM